MAISKITENYTGEVYEKMNELIDAINNIKTDIYPVGSILQTNNNTNPGTYLGGTWVEHAKGRVLVGVDTTQTEFNSVDKTGGEKTHKLTVDELPKFDITTFESRIPQFSFGTGGDRFSLTTGGGYPIGRYTPPGGDQPHNNLQPYQTVYIWRKTAN